MKPRLKRHDQIEYIGHEGHDDAWLTHYGLGVGSRGTVVRCEGRTGEKRHLSSWLYALDFGVPGLPPEDAVCCDLVIRPVD